MTTARGYRLATSVGGMLTGRGADLIIIDDPMKAAGRALRQPSAGGQQWFDTDAAVAPRRPGPRTRSCSSCSACMSTISPAMCWPKAGLGASEPAGDRRDRRAISARSQAASIGRRAGEVLHPAREQLAVLERIRRAMGSYAFRAQYQQDPLPDWTASCVQWSWFRSYAESPERRAGRPDRPELGHRLQGRGDPRLVGLHHLAVARHGPLPARRAARGGSTTRACGGGSWPRRSTGRPIRC